MAQPQYRICGGTKFDDWRYANEQGMASEVEMLCSRADVNATFPDGSSHYLWAVINGQIDLVSMLLFHGADSNRGDLNDVTPLHYAARSGDAHIASILLSYGARVNVRDRYNRTPFDIARSVEERTLGSHDRVMEILREIWLATIDKAFACSSSLKSTLVVILHVNLI